MQLNIFGVLYDKYKIKKPIRLIELFGGYGSQHFAFNYLGIEVEQYKLCEWAVKSILAYKDAHYFNDKNDYSQNLNVNEITEFLFKKGISRDYNEPMTFEQIKRMPEKTIRSIYNSIIVTKNLVNITNIKGEDLEIKDVERHEYMLTYSYPCQDLSLAGKQAGMQKGSGTRSALLWEVGRILKECKELPQILLMENVPMCHGKENIKEFSEWIETLEKLGYKNYWQDLNAKDYGIPQNRNRCFMVSLLGSYSYSFPAKMKLELRLKDMLEEEVEEKYFLSEKMINYISKSGTKNFKVNTKINLEISRPITTEQNKRAGTTNYISENLPKNYDLNVIGMLDIKGQENIRRIYDTNGLSPTLTTMDDGNRQPKILIPEATKQGYAVAHDGDGVYINRPHQKRGVVQKDMIQTLKTSGSDVGVVVKETFLQKSIRETIENNNNEIPEALDLYNRTPINNGISKTLSTDCGHLGTSGSMAITNNLRIRKLTPREVFRLMGIKDEDYNNIAVNQSASSLYHLAGDSIVVNVLMAIFKELL